MKAREDTTHSEVVREIEARVARYIEVLTVDRNTDSAADYYTEDARLVGPGMEMGRSELIDLMRTMVDAGATVQVDRRSDEIFVHGDVAYELAQANDLVLNTDGTSQAINNNLFIRWERGPDGQWRFARVLLSPVSM